MTGNIHDLASMKAQTLGVPEPVYEPGPTAGMTGEERMDFAEAQYEYELGLRGEHPEQQGENDYADKLPDTK